MKVRQLENKNQFIMEDNEKAIFQSYNSIVAIYNKKTNTLTFGKNWDYSHTTLKHLYIFINQYCCIAQTSDFYKTNNKRKYLQSLIDKNIIQYESEVE